MPKVGDLIRIILEKAHCARYFIHLRVAAMYHALKQYYWWYGIRRDIVEFMKKSLNWQQVKYEQQRPGASMQRMSIHEWTLEFITRDFVVGLASTVQVFYSIWVVVDCLTKFTYFIPVKVKYTA